MWMINRSRCRNHRTNGIASARAACSDILTQLNRAVSSVPSSGPTPRIGALVGLGSAPLSVRSADPKTSHACCWLYRRGGQRRTRRSIRTTVLGYGPVPASGDRAIPGASHTRKIVKAVCGETANTV
jgi:hypothetical protein